MSNVSSQSELTTKELVEQAIAEYHNKILPFLGTKTFMGVGDTPIGQINFFDDIEAPQNWLVCDGTVYNITDYPHLASHFESVHGSKNFYGGDGTTTFAVPDLQGEFLRGSGTNSHTNQGSGADVGVHQDATEITYSAVDSIGQLIISSYGTSDNSPRKYDSTIMDSSTRNYASRVNTAANSAPARITSRPTNTSYLICIKATPAGINYSEKEQVIGTWIDGKPLYQKTVDCGALPNQTTKQVAHGIENIENVADIMAVSTNGTIFRPLPYVHDTSVNYQVYLVVTTTEIHIGSRLSDNSNLTHTYVTLRYTKTTD